MKEKILKRLTKAEITDPDPEPRNQKLRDGIQDNLDLDIREIRLVDEPPNRRGWIVSFEDCS